MDVTAVAENGKAVNNRIRRHEALGRAEVLARTDQLLRIVWASLPFALEKLKALAQRRFTTDIRDVAAAFAAHHRLGRTTTQAIIAALRADEDYSGDTAYDLVNAITRVATHGGSSLGFHRELDLRRIHSRRDQLLMIAGNMLATDGPRFCPACKQLLDGTVAA